MADLMEDRFVVTTRSDGSFEIRHENSIFLTNNINDIGLIIKEVLGG